ncbi:MAG: type II/IV secretion system protein, partial [Rhodanobacteraceae bacterium]
PAEVCEPVGCLECRKTGFLGRTGIYEMMTITARSRGMITAQLDLDTFSRFALEDGLQPLRISAATQVRRGLTTVAEVLSVLPAGE